MMDKPHTGPLLTYHHKAADRQEPGPRPHNENSMPRSNTLPPLWTLLGAGALGGVFASLLSQSGQGVRLMVRDSQRSRLHPTLDFTALDGSAHLLPIPRCFASDGATTRRLLVMTKAGQVVEALRPLQGILGREVPIVLLHNGMGIAEQVAEQFPDNPLLVGVTSHGAMRGQHYSFRHTGKGETWIGPFNEAGRQHRHIADDLARALGQAEWDEQIQRRQWQKLAINCMINPLTALHRVKNGELSTPRFGDALTQLSVELADVMQAEGMEVGADELLRRALTVAELTADNHSSMLQDREAGRVTEIDAITGYLLARADHHGIAVPVNRSLFEAISQKAG